MDRLRQQQGAYSMWEVYNNDFGRHSPPGSISKDFHSITIMSWSQAFEKIDIILTENSFFQDNSHWETKLHNC